LTLLQTPFLNSGSDELVKIAAAVAASCKSCVVGAASKLDAVLTTSSTSGAVKINKGVLDTRGRGIRLGREGLGFSPLPMRRNMNWAVRASSALPHVELESKRGEVSEAIAQALDNCLTETHLDETVDGLGPKIRGKVSFLFLIFCLRKYLSFSSSHIFVQCLVKCLNPTETSLSIDDVLFCLRSALFL
jgi:hypothetical protein